MSNAKLNPILSSLPHAYQTNEVAKWLTQYWGEELEYWSGCFTFLADTSPKDLPIFWLDFIACVLGLADLKEEFEPQFEPQFELTKPYSWEEKKGSVITSDIEPGALPSQPNSMQSGKCWNKPHLPASSTWHPQNKSEVATTPQNIQHTSKGEIRADLKVPYLDTDIWNREMLQKQKVDILYNYSDILRYPYSSYSWRLICECYQLNSVLETPFTATYYNAESLARIKALWAYWMGDVVTMNFSLSGFIADETQVS